MAEQEQESLRQLEEELRQLKVADVVVGAMFQISSIGYRRLGPDERDLGQARLAIDALRALVPALAGAIPDQTHRDLTQVVANMQLAYANAVAEAQGDRDG
jgi:hypothetical protein